MIEVSSWTDEKYQIIRRFPTMNVTQNDRLMQVTSDTLIVGVDVGSQTHFCRGFELSRRVFKFSNTGMGFLTFLRWTEELMDKTGNEKGHSWLRAYRLLLANLLSIPSI